MLAQVWFLAKIKLGAHGVIKWKIINFIESFLKLQE